MINKAMQGFLERKQRYTSFIAEMNRQRARLPEFKQEIEKLIGLANDKLSTMKEPGLTKLSGELIGQDVFKEILEDATSYKWKTCKCEEYDAKTNFNDAGYEGSEYAQYEFQRDGRTRDELCFCTAMVTNGHVIVTVANDRASTCSDVVPNKNIKLFLS